MLYIHIYIYVCVYTHTCIYIYVHIFFLLFHWKVVEIWHRKGEIRFVQHTIDTSQLQIDQRTTGKKIELM